MRSVVWMQTSFQLKHRGAMVNLYQLSKKTRMTKKLDLEFMIFIARGFQAKKKLKKILIVLYKQSQLINFGSIPDCGLKTRQETETIAALKLMVDAAIEVREAQFASVQGN